MSSAHGLFKASRALLAAATKTPTVKTPTAKTTTAKTTTAAAAKPKKPRTKTEKPPSTRPSGILKVSPVSPAMQEFLGVPETSRTEAVKKIWEYIKLHNLQTPTDKRVILCDDKLKAIFEGKEKVGFLEIGKLLSRHFVKTEV